jgi:hypothetical protein
VKAGKNAYKLNPRLAKFDPKLSPELADLVAQGRVES